MPWISFLWLSWSTKASSSSCVVEAVGLVESTALPEDETPSTIFGDLPPEEIQEIFHGHPAWEKGEQAVQKAEEEEAKDPEPAAGDPAGAEAEKEEEETE